MNFERAIPLWFQYVWQSTFSGWHDFWEKNLVKIEEPRVQTNVQQQKFFDAQGQ